VPCVTAWVPVESGGVNFSKISGQIWGKFGEEWRWNESIMWINEGDMAKNLRRANLWTKIGH
jgi:hypothetical protein